MSRRSLAFLVLALCAATAVVGFAGVTQGSASNQAQRAPVLTPQNSGTTQSLIAVSPVNKRVVWASGRGGTFTVTTDGGATWRSGVVPGAEALQFRDVEGVSETTAYLLSIGNGGDSRIYKTTDGGATWIPQISGTTSPLYGVSFTDADTGTVAGESGTILRTTDGGVNWTPQFSGTTHSLLGVSFTDAVKGTVVGSNGTILHTITGGEPSYLLRK